MNIWNQLKYIENRVDLSNGCREISLQDLNRYGQWTPNSQNGRYLVPQLLSGSDYSGTIIERSNYRAFEEKFLVDGCNKWWDSVVGGHGTFAIVIDCENVPDYLAQEVLDFLNGLENDPIADDDLHNQMELDAQIEAWNNWAKEEFIRTIETKFDKEFEKDPEISILHDLFLDRQQRTGQYWINEQGDSMFINIKKLVDKGVTKKDFKKLQLSTVDHETALARMERAEHQVASLKKAVIKMHEKNLELPMAIDELQALLDAYNISPLNWERCKATSRLPDGRYIRF